MTNPEGSIPGYESPGLPGGAIALPLIGSFYDTTMRSRDVKKQIEAQKAEAELAYQRSQADWHRQNAYNSPEEQMKRFGAAGLNPHLIYGQGSSGLAGSVDRYQPPNIQMQGASPAYGAASHSMLETLMSVGSWMQNMRLSESEIKSKDTNIGKVEQMMGFLKEQNPRKLEQLDNSLSMYPYQRSLQRSLGERGNIAVSAALEEYRHLYGGDLSKSLEHGQLRLSDKGSGLRGQQLLRAIADARLRKSQADWFEPTTIMRMVMGMLGGITRVVPRAGGSAVKQIGKGQRGRWSTEKKRWVSNGVR